MMDPREVRRSRVNSSFPDRREDFREKLPTTVMSVSSLVASSN